MSSTSSGLKSLDKGKEAIETEDETFVASSDEEGSEYDRHDYESEVKQTKRKRNEFMKKAKKPKKTNCLGSYYLNPETKPLLAKHLLNSTKHKNKTWRKRSTKRQSRFFFCITLLLLKCYLTNFVLPFGIDSWQRNRFASRYLMLAIKMQ